MASTETRDLEPAPSRSEAQQRDSRGSLLFHVHALLFALALACFLASKIGLAGPAPGAGEIAGAPPAVSAAMEGSPDAIPSVAVSGVVTRTESTANPALVGLMTEVGRRWTYMFVSERSHGLAGAEPEVEKLRGTRVDEITAVAPDLGEGVVRMLSSSRGRSGKNPSESIEENASFYRANGSSFQLVAEQIADPTSGLVSIERYEVPLSMLEAGAEPGQRWSVGVRSQQDLHMDLEGEVLGVQDVETPKGPFERCLVIRLTGQISGVVEANGSRMEVPSGDYSVTRWYAPGVGLVLAKEEITQTLILEDGRSMDYSERSQFALRSTEKVAAAAPAPGTP